MLRLLHIINPVKVTQSSPLYVAQPLVFESMKIARENARDLINIEFIAPCFPEDEEVIPSFMQAIPSLKRSVQDEGALEDKRKLPFIKDILELALAQSDAEYIVYTNADIILQPYFYTFLKQQFEQGIDALTINRRRLPSTFHDVSQLPEIYASPGRSHPGIDCFVFHRSLWDEFVIGDVCVGIPFMEMSLAYNLYAHAKKGRWVHDLHLSTHIGLEVMHAFDQKLYDRNRAIFNAHLVQLRPKLNLQKMPYAALPHWQRMIKWGLNPTLPFALWRELQREAGPMKLKYLWNEIRFTLLQR